PEHAVGRPQAGDEGQGLAGAFLDVVEVGVIDVDDRHRRQYPPRRSGTNPASFRGVPIRRGHFPLLLRGPGPVPHPPGTSNPAIAPHPADFWLIASVVTNSRRWCSPISSMAASSAVTSMIEFTTRRSVPLGLRISALWSTPSGFVR